MPEMEASYGVHGFGENVGGRWGISPAPDKLETDSIIHEFAKLNGRTVEGLGIDSIGRNSIAQHRKYISGSGEVSFQGVVLPLLYSHFYKIP